MGPATDQRIQGTPVQQLNKEDIQAIGKTLNGYFAEKGIGGKIDGNDPQSVEKGLKRFQTMNNMPATGQLDKYTGQALERVEIANKGILHTAIDHGLGEAGSKYLEKGAAPYKAAGGAISTYGKAVKDTIAADYDQGVALAKGAGAAAKQLTAPVVNTANSYLSAASNWLNSTLVLPAKQTYQAAAQTVSENITAAKNEITATAQLTGELLADGSKAVGNGLSYAGQKIADGYNATVDTAANTMLAGYNTGKAGFDATTQLAHKTVTFVGKTAVDGYNATVDTAANTMLTGYNIGKAGVDATSEAIKTGVDTYNKSIAESEKSRN